MVRAVRQIPRWTIDGRRVLALSGVLLLHIVLLGLVMLPREPLTFSPARPDDSWVPTVDLVDPPKPPPLPPPPIAVPPPPVNLAVATPPPVVVPTVTPTPATTTRSDVALQMPSELPVLPPGPSDAGSATEVGIGQGALLTLTTISGRPPAYPRRELAKGIEGDVILRVLVDEFGVPQTIEVVGGTRNRNFEIAASNALKRWRFRPHTVDGVPRAAWARVPVTFRLDN